jgi:hypothetical protein
MRIKILIGLILALMAGCWIAIGQHFVGRPLMPLNSGFNPYPLDTVTNVSFASYSVSRKLSEF